MLYKSLELSELIGITLGDGNLGHYPRCHYLRIYCSLKEEQYAKEVIKILKNIFGKKPYCRRMKERGVLYLEISKKNLDKILGIPIGSKKENQVRMPSWVLQNNNTLISCLRGFFDTDGCCYVTGGKYKIINFRNVIKPLLDDTYNGLMQLGFNPYRRENAVELGRQCEVSRFFDTIAPRNLKHYKYVEAR
jgi:intein/homing endonuclease